MQTPTHVTCWPSRWAQSTFSARDEWRLPTTAEPRWFLRGRPYMRWTGATAVFFASAPGAFSTMRRRTGRGNVKGNNAAKAAGPESEPTDRQFFYVHVPRSGTSDPATIRLQNVALSLVIDRHGDLAIRTFSGPSCRSRLISRRRTSPCPTVLPHWWEFVRTIRRLWLW